MDGTVPQGSGELSPVFRKEHCAEKCGEPDLLPCEPDIFRNIFLRHGEFQQQPQHCSIRGRIRKSGVTAHDGVRTNPVKIQCAVKRENALREKQNAGRPFFIFMKQTRTLGETVSGEKFFAADGDLGDWKRICMQRCNPASRFRTGENFPVVFRQIIEEALSHRPCSVRSGQKLLTGDLDCIGRTGVLYRGCENLQGVVFQQVVAVKKDSISAFRMCESGVARGCW